MSRYPKCEYEAGSDSSVLQCGRGDQPKTVAVAPDLPGNVIVVHGVNDVGVSYAQVEAGLCAGLNERLRWQQQAPLQPAQYRLPTAEDAKRLEADPDAVFFKRAATAQTRSPVIPFYWGYRAARNNFTPGTRTLHGQAVDHWGNRLDKDFSKGGGPFANATSSLPDMWNRGFGAGPGDLVDRLSRDPLRPVLDAPGRLYMVLAAQRLAALVDMIRDYDADDTVSLVAHSQDCMLSLLAQAFLLEQGRRPADTLVLTHPPYSLVDDMPWTSDMAELARGGEDEAMRAHYPLLSGRQTLHARLQTLVNIVQGVARKRHTVPVFEQIHAANSRGMVSAQWEAANDRDNRGKVYLYFCPEDMTVALDNVQGIGWQGVPDYKWGSRVDVHREPVEVGRDTGPPAPLHRREPLKELGPSFLQRVFTARRRVAADATAGAQPQPVLLGAPPHDYPLRVKGEDDHGHVAKGAATLRSSLVEVEWPPSGRRSFRLFETEASRRVGLRRVTGEPLARPVEADMYAGAVTRPGQPQGAHEGIDPIDAAISVTSRYGLQDREPELIEDPRPAFQRATSREHDPLPGWECDAVQKALNEDKPPGEQRRVVSGVNAGEGKLRVVLSETGNEARLRQQQSVCARSFHGAIFGSTDNHRQVTAYDIAIGQGKAVSDPGFYAYLCAVADWRLKEPQKATDQLRPGVLGWKKFLERFDAYYSQEPDDRKRLIRDNCIYYSSGKLPPSLPLLPDGLPAAVVSETMHGKRITPTKVVEAEDEFTRLWMADQDGPRSDGGQSA